MTDKHSQIYPMRGRSLGIVFGMVFLLLAAPLIEDTHSHDAHDAEQHACYVCLYTISNELDAVEFPESFTVTYGVSSSDRMSARTGEGFGRAYDSTGPPLLS